MIHPNSNLYTSLSHQYNDGSGNNKAKTRVVKEKERKKNPSFPYQKQKPIFIIVQIPPLPPPYTSSLSKPKGIPQYHFCSNQQLCHSIQQEGLILAYQMRS